MTALRLTTILIVSTICGLFVWSVGIPAHLVAWSTAGVVVASAAITWLSSLHTPPTGFGGQRLQAGDLIPDPSGSGEWVAYLSPGAKLANVVALAVYTVVGVFLVVHHPVPGVTALWTQHTNGIFEPVPWLLWAPFVTIWVALAWVIAGYWLWPHLLDDLARKYLVRNSSAPGVNDRFEMLLACAPVLFAAVVLVPAWVNKLNVTGPVKAVIVGLIAVVATVTIRAWYRRPVVQRESPTVLPTPDQAVTDSVAGRDAA